MATVAQGTVPTRAGGNMQVASSADFTKFIDHESPGAFSIEGTKKEPTTGQIWPRLAEN